MSMSSQVKIIGANGQLSLGKEFAGKMVMIDQLNEGVWMIKSGDFIPHTEQWLYEDSNLSKLDKALDWAAKNPPKDNFDELLKDLEK
jgi:hypothetical protein